MEQVNALNKPMWGAATSKIVSVLSKKYGYVVPPKMVTEFIFNKLSSGGAIENATFNDDGPITFHDSEVGDVVKKFFCNKQYVKWAFENIDLPMPLKIMLKTIM
jgi:hypothetical protein